MSQPVNGHGAVDLGAVKQLADQHQRLDEQRDHITRQLLTQAGLQCPCGERIRGDGVIYFHIVEEIVGHTPAGPQLGLNLRAQTFHSRECMHAIMAERTAIARRNGPAGAVTWLDERRAARATRGQ